MPRPSGPLVNFHNMENCPQCGVPMDEETTCSTCGACEDCCSCYSDGKDTEEDDL